jgi:predicted PurR-regulated permease PerM
LASQKYIGIVALGIERMMDWQSHFRTTGTALKNWFIAQCYDSLAVAVLWLVGLWIIGIP